MKRLFAILLALCLLAGLSAMADQEFVGPAENIDVYVHSYIPFEYNPSEQFTVLIPEGFDLNYPRASDSREVRIEIPDQNGFPMMRGINVRISGADNGIGGNRDFGAPNFLMVRDENRFDGGDSSLIYAVEVERYGGDFAHCSNSTIWRECDEAGNVTDEDTWIIEYKKCPGEDESLIHEDWSAKSDWNDDENWANSVANVTVRAFFDGELAEGNYNDTLHFRIDTLWTLNRENMETHGWEYVSREKWVDGDRSGIEDWEQVNGWAVKKSAATGAIYYVRDDGMVKDADLNDVDGENVPNDLQPTFWIEDQLFGEGGDPNYYGYRIAFARRIGSESEGE